MPRLGPHIEDAASDLHEIPERTCSWRDCALRNWVYAEPAQGPAITEDEMLSHSPAVAPLWPPCALPDGRMHGPASEAIGETGRATHATTAAQGMHVEAKVINVEAKVSLPAGTRKKKTTTVSSAVYLQAMHQQVMQGMQGVLMPSPWLKPADAGGASLAGASLARCQPQQPAHIQGQGHQGHQRQLGWLLLPADEADTKQVNQGAAARRVHGGARQEERHVGVYIIGASEPDAAGSRRVEGQVQGVMQAMPPSKQGPDQNTGCVWTSAHSQETDTEGRAEQAVMQVRGGGGGGGGEFIDNQQLAERSKAPTVTPTRAKTEADADIDVEIEERGRMRGGGCIDNQHVTARGRAPTVLTPTKPQAQAAVGSGGEIEGEGEGESGIIIEESDVPFTERRPAGACGFQVSRYASSARSHPRKRRRV